MRRLFIILNFEIKYYSKEDINTKNNKYNKGITKTPKNKPIFAFLLPP